MKTTRSPRNLKRAPAILTETYSATEAQTWVYESLGVRSSLFDSCARLTSSRSRPDRVWSPQIRTNRRTHTEPEWATLFRKLIYLSSLVSDFVFPWSLAISKVEKFMQVFCINFFNTLPKHFQSSKKKPMLEESTTFLSLSFSPRSKLPMLNTPPHMNVAWRPVIWVALFFIVLYTFSLFKNKKKDE